MTDKELEMIHKLNLNEEEFEPKKISAEERLEAIEAAILEMIING